MQFIQKDLTNNLYDSFSGSLLGLRPSVEEDIF